MRRLVSIFLLGVVGLAPTAMAAPAHASQDNAAVAVNTRDGASVWRIAFSIRRIVDGDVDATNAAVAYASCTECQTVAIAMQIVLVSGDVESATPTNLAIAVNDQCVECETLAAAYQFVFADGTDVRLTGEGRHRLAELRVRLQRLRRSDLPIEQIAAEVDAIASEMRTILREELTTRPTPSTSTTSSSSTSTPTTTAQGGTTSSTSDVSTTSSTAPESSPTSSP